MSSKKRGVGVNPNALFAPSDGQFYTSKDVQRCFAEQQPIVTSEMPRYLLPHPDSLVQPPLLRYGWLLGQKKLLQILLDHFPDQVICSSHLDCIIEPGDRGRWSAPYDVEVPHMRWTLQDPGLAKAICERLELPSSDLINFELMIDRSEFPQAEWGLSVGTNYMGCLEDGYVQRVQAIFAPNVQPKWYLDPYKCMWTRPSKIVQLNAYTTLETYRV